MTDTYSRQGEGQGRHESAALRKMQAFFGLNVLRAKMMDNYMFRLVFEKKSVSLIVWDSKFAPEE